MADTTLNRFVASGTNAERLAFTPSPPTPSSGPDPGYFFFETDTGDTYSWDGAAWQLVGATGGGTVTNTGTLTSGALLVGNGTVDLKVGLAAANSKLLGSGASGSGSAYAELSLGTNLSMSGTTLNASGGGGAYPDFVDPTSPTFAWINQGSATIGTDTVQGSPAVVLYGPNQAGANMRIRKKSALTPPYTVTAAHLLTAIPNSAINVGLLLFRESSSGKLHVFGLTNAGSRFQFFSQYWSAVNVGSTTYASREYFAVGGGALIWVRIKDDNTNRICQWSADGKNWLTISSTARTTDLTADEVGFALDNNGSTYDSYLTMLSWEEV